MIYEFSRFITKKEAINRYGKLGFREHKESVFIPAESLEEANKRIEPFNYKKHIKYRYVNKSLICPFGTDQIIDMGPVN